MDSHTIFEFKYKSSRRRHWLLVILLEIQIGRLVGILHAIFVFIVISIQLSIARAEAREFPDIHFGNFAASCMCRRVGDKFWDVCAKNFPKERG